jgi:Rrf2 family protein
MSAKRINSSMQLTRAADYALRVMIHLAAQPERERALLPQLAEITAAPESFLSKVLQALTRARMVGSRRGKSGGFVLMPRGRQATVREVIEAIDGPVRLNICLTNGRSCVRKGFCPAHPVWERAQQAMMDVLDAARIADLAAQASPAQAERFAPAVFFPAGDQSAK